MNLYIFYILTIQIMKNIKLYKLLESNLAIDEKKWAELWNTILEKYKDKSIKLDFSDINVIISPFMRALLKPLYKNKIKFSWENFWNERIKNIFMRVEEEFENIWTISIKELDL